MSKCNKSVVYLDNNGTTLISANAAKTHSDWLRCYNPSSKASIAKPAKDILDKAHKTIYKHCGITGETHEVIFTSGASESNSMILQKTVIAYRSIKNVLPHIITTKIEHHSIMECVKCLEEMNQATVTYIEPNVEGKISPDDIEEAITPNTCIVSVMYANNELGTINNIKKIGEICLKNGIPLHTDAVQLFGKMQINIPSNNITALSMSFHKLYGPKGVGLLIINKKLIEGYHITALVHGSQQNGLRGGTQNVPGIASSMVALKETFKSRATKNQRLQKFREYFMETLSKHYSISDIYSYIKSEVEDSDENKKDYLRYTEIKTDHPPVEIVLLGPSYKSRNESIPNTLMLSIAKNEGAPFCNMEFQKRLDKAGLIIGIGSSCMSDSPLASHVLYAINAPPVIRRGALRISFSDYNKMPDIKKAINIFLSELDRYLQKLARMTII